MSIRHKPVAMYLPGRAVEAIGRSKGPLPAITAKAAMTDRQNTRVFIASLPRRPLLGTAPAG
ncbi:hypothetical protein DO73_4201 [Burkholderia pseudomallei]|nr:hypothetical protein DO73_4201 [Burkholderia pseudomallei]